MNPLSLISDKEEFMAHTGAKLNYSTGRLSENEFFIRPHGLLFETGIREQPLTGLIFWKPAFFQTSGDFAFDIFAASFYLVSRYEEYLPFQPDSYGRFPYQSQSGF